MGGAIFSQFFLLTLYMQQVLHYSAVQTGVAFAAITLTVVVFSNVAQALVTRLGVRRVLTVVVLRKKYSDALVGECGIPKLLSLRWREEHRSPLVWRDRNLK